MALLMTATPSAAQDVPVQDVPAADWPIPAGSRVRVRSPLVTGRYDRYAILGVRYAIGSVVSATSDTLTFRADGDSTDTAIIPTPRILQIDIARGTHTNKKNGALMGLAAGLVAGEAIAAVTHASCQSDGCNGFYSPALLNTGRLIGALGGAIVGAWMGRRPSETWVPVKIPRR
jgi:hypothetical protein